MQTFRKPLLSGPQLERRQFEFNCKCGNVQRFHGVVAAATKYMGAKGWTCTQQKGWRCADCSRSAQAVRP